MAIQYDLRVRRLNTHSPDEYARSVGVFQQSSKSEQPMNIAHDVYCTLPRYLSQYRHTSNHTRKRSECTITLLHTHTYNAVQTYSSAHHFGSLRNSNFSACNGHRTNAWPYTARIVAPK